MTTAEQTAAAKAFAEEWKGKGDEKQHTQLFWIGFIRRVLGVEDAEQHIQFEKQVKYGGHTTFIDAYIPATKVLIEQKSLGVDLDKPEPRHGEMLTPFKQAEQYSQKLVHSQKARYIIVSNFETFRIHDLNQEGYESTYEEIRLCDLEKECHRFGFLVDSEKQLVESETEISKQAGDIVRLLYDALRAQYNDPNSPETLESLNKLCVRLVFCLYAEDAGVFDKHLMFHDYLKQFDAKNARTALLDLFQVLNTKYEDRKALYLNDDLAAFPYVNGGLFGGKPIEIPRLTDEIMNLILLNASEDFDWSGISPTIFGAIFESTLNLETRRSGGMHYTSIENIHKVIDPLFLDDLKAELEQLLEKKQRNERRTALEAYRDKLASLCFLDPACGSGNFLTESYTSLRRLENRALRQIIADGDFQVAGQMLMTAEGELNPIKVSIEQFYGIEINDFAVSVAMTALWIAESQMMEETKKIIPKVPPFLPLKTFTNIHEGNALRVDWASVVPREKLSYIMGNPPFVGARLMSDAQKDDVFTIFDGVKNNGNLDYVSCWYQKAAEMMTTDSVRTALVSTNSITQGEQVAILWKHLFRQGVHIDFAHRTFIWDSEASLKAHVHCVIVGFSKAPNSTPRKIYDNGAMKQVSNINGYLVEADDIVIDSRSKPLCAVPEIGIGNKPIDGGNYLFTEEEMQDFIKKEPAAAKYFRKWLGSVEFINGYCRYCLWLGDCSPKELLSMPECMKRVDAVRAFRLASSSAGTRKLADKPTRFHVENMPQSNYIVIPEVSSQNRKYIPIGFLTPDILCSNLVKLIPNATLYHFGILTSNVHMAWMRAVAGRLKSDYRYSKDIVYNNFPWCSPTPEQRAKIEKTAQHILDVRAKYSDSCFADMYGDKMYLYGDLVTAHEANDKAVMQAYGFSSKMTESEIVAELMKMYQKLTEEKA